MGDVQKEKESKGVSQYIKIIVYMVIGLVAIFFVLPTTIIFFGKYFPGLVPQRSRSECTEEPS